MVLPKKDYLNYIHYFRGLAIMFIVALHATITFRWHDALERKSMLVLFNNSTVLFVFIAGFLFYHLNKDRFNYVDYLKKKLWYVIIPYLIISIPAIVDKFIFDKVGEHWWMDQSFSDHSPIVKIILLLTSGRHMGVFWFIPMISIIYLLAPLILWFTRTRSFMYIVPLVVFQGLFIFRFGYHANIMLSLEYFLPVYLFGIWIYRIKDFLFDHSRAILWVTGIVCVAMHIGEFVEWIPFDEALLLRDADYTVCQFNFNKLKMHVLAVFFLVFFYRLNTREIPSLRLLGDYSFGIFFVHLYVLQLYRLLNVSGRLVVPTSIVMYVIFYFVILSVTVGIIKLVKVVLKDRSRYVIGS